MPLPFLAVLIFEGVVVGGFVEADARVRAEVVRVGGEGSAVGRHLIQVDACLEKTVRDQSCGGNETQLADGSCSCSGSSSKSPEVAGK